MVSQETYKRIHGLTRPKRWRNSRDLARDIFIASGNIFPIIYKYGLDRAFGKADPWTYLVYSEGRAGTVSLYNSLVGQGFKPSIHSHMLNPDNIKKAYYPPTRNGLVYYRAIVRKQKPIKLLTITRNPIDRCISWFFRELSKMPGDPEQLRVDKAVELFIELHESYIPPDWFTHEMKPVLGIDIYQYDFPIDKGYLLLRKDNVDMLMMRLELDNSIRENLLRDFLPADSFTWNREQNSIALTKIASLYKKFKMEAAIPEDLLRTIVREHYASKFYSEEFLESRVRFWSGDRS